MKPDLRSYATWKLVIDVVVATMLAVILVAQWFFPEIAGELASLFLFLLLFRLGIQTIRAFVVGINEGGDVRNQRPATRPHGRCDGPPPRRLTA